MPPQEIIDIIIDDIASTGDKATLRACNSVSKSFRTRSKPHLFADIELVVDTRVRRSAGRLRSILKSEPELVSGIRSFKMTVTDPFPFQSIVTGGVEEIGKVLWSRKIGNVATVVGSMLGILRSHLLWVLQAIAQSAQVQKFSLGSSLYLNWDVLLIQSLLLTIRSNPRLHTLELENVCNLPIVMLTGNPNHASSLQHLILKNSTVSRLEPTIFKSIVLPWTQLQTLTLIQTPFFSYLARRQSYVLGKTFMNWIPHPLPLLSSLIIGPISSLDDIASISQLVTSGAQTITSLEIRIWERTTLSETFPLHDMVALQHLKFATHADDIQDFEARLLFIGDILRSAIAPMQLRSFTLEFALRFTIQWVTKLIVNPNSKGAPESPQNLFTNRWVPKAVRRAWGTLDEVLSSHRFPDLQQAFINLNLIRSEHDWIPVDIPNAANILPKLSICQCVEVKLNVAV
ncbi:hypothetical protein GALMADRAFT_250459 [Galerina marginata CBS 339.88]|uniref:F-box domain-containing protein n=1 Tax=Galerina marginata (strain CBS 339.88) TaxID=685588 RepID=A0A067SU99_GALM3|nr:hypothetical protein GALMADRAFT_250459 [Galerina marginata CBS 339.88]